MAKKLPVFNFLTIGQRGVGKTVFLAGCYSEMNDAFLREKEEHSLWFEGQNPQDKEHLDTLLNYISITGEYPPATLKITEFNFNLKRQERLGAKTLCHFRWYDIPGEYCHPEHPEFQQMVSDSQSCCIFINAARLVQDSSYLQSLDSVFEQATEIARLQGKMKRGYAFALILTQCDRLTDQVFGKLRAEETIQPFINRLEAEGAKYLRFYSEVPITKVENHYKLNPKGTAIPLIWLASELQKISSQTAKISSPIKHSSIQDCLTLVQQSRKKLMVAGISGVVLASIVGIAINFPKVSSDTSKPSVIDEQIGQYQSILEDEPHNIEALVALSQLYLDQGQLEQAIPIMETITQQQPDYLDWQLNLAKLYELTQEKYKAEAVYDRILAQDDQHFYALLGKALLRQKQGDRQTAQRLFQQAAQVAPTSDLKEKVRQIAQASSPDEAGSGE